MFKLPTAGPRILALAKIPHGTYALANARRHNLPPPEGAPLVGAMTDRAYQSQRSIKVQLTARAHALMLAINRQCPSASRTCGGFIGGPLKTVLNRNDGIHEFLEINAAHFTAPFCRSLTPVRGWTNPIISL